MNEKKHYEPTEKDYKKAESMMSGRDELISKEVEKMSTEIEKLGLSGHLTIFKTEANEEESGKKIIEGILNLKGGVTEIKIVKIITYDKEDLNEEDLYDIFINGEEVDSKKARELFEMFEPAALNLDEINSLIREEEAKTKEESEKDVINFLLSLKK